MGKKKAVRCVDDIDGTTADETIEFGIDGQRYAIELSSANAEVLRHTLKEWADRARRVGVPRQRHVARIDPWRKHVSGDERLEIRAWCHDNGYQVGSRGPLPFGAVDAFRTARSQR